MFVKKKMITTVVAQIMIVRIALLYVRYNGHGGNISLRLEFWLMRSFEVPSSLTIIISGFRTSLRLQILKDTSLDMA